MANDVLAGDHDTVVYCSLNALFHVHVAIRGKTSDCYGVLNFLCVKCSYAPFVKDL